MARAVPLQPEWRALDYGAGTGLLTLNLQPRVASLLARDASRGMLEKAMDPHSIHHRYTPSVRGVGYCLNAPEANSQAAGKNFVTSPALAAPYQEMENSIEIPATGDDGKRKSFLCG